MSLLLGHSRVVSLPSSVDRSWLGYAAAVMAARKRQLERFLQVPPTFGSPTLFDPATPCRLQPKLPNSANQPVQT